MGKWWRQEGATKQQWFGSRSRKAITNLFRFCSVWCVKVEDAQFES